MISAKLQQAFHKLDKDMSKGQDTVHLLWKEIVVCNYFNPVIIVLWYECIFFSPYFADSDYLRNINLRCFNKSVLCPMAFDLIVLNVCVCTSCI